MKKTSPKHTRKEKLLPPPVKLLLITGEHSGEILALSLIRELKKTREWEIWGTGGDLLKNEGVNIIEHINKLSIIGLIEAIKAYGFLKKLMAKIIQLCREKEIRHVLLVDYPGFNLRLAKKLKKSFPDIQIFYFVSPQIWAWNYKRIRIIKQTIRKMYVLFPFEEEIYRRENVDVLWVGHPLKFQIPQRLKSQKPLSYTNSPLIGILPGSRLSEVKSLLPVMLKSAEILQEKFPEARFLVSSVEKEGMISGYIHSQIQNHPRANLEVIPEASLRIMKHADVLIVASGTATLEAAYFQKPMVICYKIHWLNFWFFSFLVKTKYIGLPNLLAPEEVALELLQNEVTPENIASEVTKILSDEPYRNTIIQNLKKIPFTPGNIPPAKLFAEDFLTFFN